jgi:hypothetical protein
LAKAHLRYANGSGKRKERIMNANAMQSKNPNLSSLIVRSAVPAAGLTLPEGNPAPEETRNMASGANGARVQLYWFLPPGAQLTTAPTAARAATLPSGDEVKPPIFFAEMRSRKKAVEHGIGVSKGGNHAATR